MVSVCDTGSMSTVPASPAILLIVPVPLAIFIRTNDIIDIFESRAFSLKIST